MKQTRRWGGRPGHRGLAGGCGFQIGDFWSVKVRREHGACAGFWQVYRETDISVAGGMGKGIIFRLNSNDTPTVND